VTPAVNLKLLTNNVRGEQEFDFPKGQRMNRIEAVFPLNGELNRYPFDRYESTLWILMLPLPRSQPFQSSRVRTSGGPWRRRGDGPSDSIVASSPCHSSFQRVSDTNPAFHILREQSSQYICWTGNVRQSFDEDELVIFPVDLVVRRVAFFVAHSGLPFSSVAPHHTFPPRVFWPRHTMNKPVH
jgi:hypothetical protein